jgi:hypothetical protein
LVCPGCKKEGHVARSCPEIMPWECIAPFCGLAAPELGFHIIQDDDSGDSAKESTNLVVITIKEGKSLLDKLKGSSRPMLDKIQPGGGMQKKLQIKNFK